MPEEALKKPWVAPEEALKNPIGTPGDPIKNPWRTLEKSEDPRRVFSLPFVISVFVAVVVSRHDVHQQDVFGSGVQTRHLHFVTGEHSSAQTEKQ